MGNVTQNGGDLITSNATIGGNLQITGGGVFSVDGERPFVETPRSRNFRPGPRKTRFAART